MNTLRIQEYVRFILKNKWFLMFGFVMAFTSSFGQTFFIGLFTPSIEATFELNHSQWGSIFMTGTLFSAAALTFTGSRIDRMPLRRYSLLVCGCLAAGCLLTAVAPTALFLIPAIFLLRHAGQGLATHTALAGMIKNFREDRGKAVAIATLGFPAGRAALPIFTVMAIAAFGWRETYASCGIIILLLIFPIIAALLKNHPNTAPVHVLNKSTIPSTHKNFRLEPTLRQVLHTPHIYLLVPGLLAPSFFDTALSFHLLPIATLKSWPAEWVTTGYAIYGATSVIGSIWIGTIIDKHGSVRFLPYSLVPYIGGLLVLAFLRDPAWAWLYLGLFGLGSGIRVTLIPVVLSELYGTRHIGAIRSFIATIGVFASAIGPPILGLGLDLQASIETMGTIAIIYFVLAILLTMHANRRQSL